MEVNDFVGTEKLKSGSGIELAAGSIISGGAYMPIMLRVEDYDIKDWSPVFTPALVKSFNMAIGYKSTITADLTNTIAIGTSVVPTTSNVVQLGSWSQQVLTIKEPAYRLDERDMADVSDSAIGLTFIDTLKPIKYRAMYRESNIDEKFPLPHPINEPEVPIRDIYRIQQPDGSFTIDEKSYGDAVAEYTKKNEAFLTYRSTLEKVLEDRKNAYAENGSVKESSYSYAFKPSELKSSEDSDFNPIYGSLNADAAVYYKPTQLIVPIVKAIQEEHKLIIDLRTDVDLLRSDVDTLEIDVEKLEGKVAVVEESVKSVTETTIPDLVGRLDSLEEAASNPDTGEPTDLSGVNQRIDEVGRRVDDVVGRVTNLENSSTGGGGDSGGGEGGVSSGSARSINIDYTYSLNFRDPETGTTKYALRWGTPDHPSELAVGMKGTYTNIYGTLVNIRGGAQTDLWAGNKVIKWMGSDFSPVVNTGSRITLGSDRNEMFFRWSTVYTSTDVNVSSDMRLKTTKRPLEEREKAAALEIKESIGLYKLLRSVDEKGDAARLHAGVYAQDVVTIFEKHGIDALSEYAFIGRDNSEDGKEGYLNIRYGELALFILAAL